jgi:hypothetical protein
MRLGRQGSGMGLIRLRGSGVGCLLRFCRVRGFKEFGIITSLRVAANNDRCQTDPLLLTFLKRQTTPVEFHTN